MGDAERVTLQVLNGIVTVVLGLTVCFALHNVIRYILTAEIRKFYIVAYYAIAIPTLLFWMLFAGVQTKEPETRYLVYQLVDDPRWFHICADISMNCYFALFALVTAMIYQID